MDEGIVDLRGTKLCYACVDNTEAEADNDKIPE